jgi:hypothetical protein
MQKPGGAFISLVAKGRTGTQGGAEGGKVSFGGRGIAHVAAPVAPGVMAITPAY